MENEVQKEDAVLSNFLKRIDEGFPYYYGKETNRETPLAGSKGRAAMGWESFGEPFLPPKPNVYKSRKGAQEAHEAIDQLRLITILKK
jgi:DNA topoisomerase IA